MGPDLALASTYMLMPDEVVCPVKYHLCSLGIRPDLALLLDKQVAAVAMSSFLPAATFLGKPPLYCTYSSYGSTIVMQSTWGHPWQLQLVQTVW